MRAEIIGKGGKLLLVSVAAVFCQFNALPAYSQSQQIYKTGMSPVSPARTKTAALSASQYERRGIARMHARNYEDAIDDFTKSIELSRNYHNFDLRAAAYAMVFNWNCVVADETMAINMNPEDEIAYGNRALAYLQLRQYIVSAADYQKAIQINPRRPEFFEGLGEVCCYTKQYQRAIEYFDRAILFNNKFGDAYFFRGLCYRALGRKADSARDLLRAKALGYKPGTVSSPTDKHN